MKKKKSNNKVKITVSVSKYFILLTALLIPAIYLVVKGSSEPIWSIVPLKIQPLLLNGNDVLSGISQSYICSYIFYIVVNFLPEKKQQIEENRKFLYDVQSYMSTMYAAVRFNLTNPFIFCKKMYDMPKEPRYYKAQKGFEDMIDVLGKNFIEIESNYAIYMSFKAKKVLTEDDKLFIDNAHDKLKMCTEEYQDYALKIYRYTHPNMYKTSDS